MKREVARMIADYVVMALAVVVGAGSIVLFAWTDRPVLVALALTPGAALAWDALLSCVFFAQHSILVRRPIRARLGSVIPDRYDGASYAITSGLALALFAILFQPVGPAVLVLRGVWRVLVDVLALAALGAFVWAISVFRSFDPFGLGPIRRHLRGVPSSRPPTRPPSFVVRGPYAFVRHPLYTAIIVLLWATPEMTPSRLLVAILWTAWICVGARLEERDLIADFGDTYRAYRHQVPFLVPWKGRVAFRSAAGDRAA